MISHSNGLMGLLPTTPNITVNQRKIKGTLTGYIMHSLACKDSPAVQWIKLSD